jgi:hypothetical protein
LHRKLDVNVPEATAAAATMQSQMCRDALEQQSALFWRQRRGRGHDDFKLLI